MATNEQPKTWHYGLIARWWAEFNVASDEELAFYRGIIEQNGEPALDLACGTGRILLPLLRAGFDVDGCDISSDMLELCRAKAELEGLCPHLFNQAMHALHMPRSYRTIIICDSFGIGGQRNHDIETLRRVRRHLEPGGALVFSHDLPYSNAEQWDQWLPGRRASFPQPWPESGPRKRAANGDEIELISRIHDFDALEQRLTLQMRATLWQKGRKVSQEEHALRTNLYLCRELISMLERAGFKGTEVRCGYTDLPADAEQTKLVFIAHKIAKKPKE